MEFVVFYLLHLGIVVAVRYSEKRLLVWPEKYCVEIMKTTMAICKQNNSYLSFKKKDKENENSNTKIIFIGILSASS